MTMVGTVLILGASVGISFCLISEGRRRICALEALCSLIEFIRQNIEAFGTPIDGILSTCRIEYFEKSPAGEILRQNGIVSLAKEKLLPIGKDVQTDFETFAENIGKGYRDEEIKRCNYYLSRFQSYLSEEHTRFEQYRPMYRYLPFLGALSVIVLLI